MIRQQGRRNDFKAEVGSLKSGIDSGKDSETFNSMKKWEASAPRPTRGSSPWTGSMELQSNLVAITPNISSIIKKNGGDAPKIHRQNCKDHVERQMLFPITEEMHFDFS